MSKIKLKPSKKGLKVTNPKHGRDLKEEGELVSLSIYWRRRLKSGEVVEVKEEKKTKSKSKPKKFNSDIDKESEE